MDFRKFLAATSDPIVLPYFGGTRVDTADRRLRVAPGSSVVEPGWWKFRVDGRRAIPLERAEPVDLSALPAVRGHWAEGWIYASGKELVRVALPPAEEPAPLARCTGRRWHSGDLLLESIDFEDDAELEARAALEEGRPLGALRGVTPSLRAAFGYAVAAAVARSLDIPVSPREVAGHVHEIADAGSAAATTFLQAIAEERRRAAETIRLRTMVGTARPRARAGDPAARADTALEGAGARMLNCRRLPGSQLEVRFELAGERIICVVDADSLQVLDAGVCLAGADRELTLDSLPSVLREAIETDQLNITRHG
jgi:hypothetical protein